EDMIDVDDLLRDDVRTDLTRRANSDRPHDQIKAISDALRSHLVGARAKAPLADTSPRSHPRDRDVGSPRDGGDTTRYREGPAQYPTRSPSRKSSTLSHEHANTIAKLAATFATAVRAVPITAEGITTMLETAEPVGTMLLAANVLRAPREERGGSAVQP